MHSHIDGSRAPQAARGDTHLSEAGDHSVSEAVGPTRSSGPVGRRVGRRAPGRMGGLVWAVVLVGLVALGAMALPAAASAAPPEGISGTVSNTEGEPIDGAKVCAYETTIPTQLECTTTGVHGEYTLTVPAASYKVSFEASGFTTQWYADQPTWSSAQSVPVTAGKVTKDINAAMVEEGTGFIAGQVTNSSGQGLGGIQVCTYGAESYGSCTETGGNGEYTLSGLGTGTYDVSFSPQYNSCEEEQGEKVRCVINANVISQSVSGVHVKSKQTTTENVTLQTGGQVSGTVTNASITHPGIGKIEVSATRVNGKGEFECNSGVCYGYAWTNSSGAYTISGLSSGSYKINFDGNICSEVTKEGKKEQECVISYVGAYYHEKASFEKGETVNVTTGSNTTGINEALREAFPTTPASTAAPALTGTPVVGQTLSCSQGTWSHEPTYLAYQWLRNGTPIAGQTGATYAVQAADPGKSITCVVWAGNGAGVASAMSNAVAIPVPLALFAGVKVKGSVASVKLRCPGPGACSGTLKLVASMRHGKRTTNVTVGTASFSIAAGKTATIHVRLTAKGRSLMTKAGKRGLKVKLAGTGVKGRALVLKQAKPAKHGKKKKK